MNQVAKDPSREEARQARYFADMVPLPAICFPCPLTRAQVQLSMSDCMLSHWGLSTPTSGGKQAGRQPTGSTLCDSFIAEALRLSMNEASRTAAARVPATVRGGDPTFPVWKLNRKHKVRSIAGTCKDITQGRCCFINGC